MDNESEAAGLRKKLSEWRETTLEPAVARYPEREEEFTTVSGAQVKRLYTPLDLEDVDYEEELGFPGQYPFTRGVYPTMYRGRLWTMRQYAGFGSAEESNERYRYLLEQGQTGLSVAFDLPTQVGLDSDHPLATGEVGKVGVAIDSLEDMRILFDEIPLDQVSVSMTINAPAAVLLAMFVATAEEQGVERAALSGTIQNDILKEYIARGTYIYPPKPSMRLITDTFEFCSEEIPRWNTISISGYHIREAGSTAVQEVAFTLANAIAYVEAALEAGLAVDEFAPRLSFFFNSHLDFFEEVAKFRAARRMWAKLMKERFGAEKSRSCMMRFHAQTGGVTLTAQQPQNNVVRVAWQALAAILGGTQSLHTNAMDEALALPTASSARLALRTQQLLAHESGVANTIDPLAGSYFVEKLTSDIEEEAWDYLDRIEEQGGAVKAIELGFVQREIEESSYRYQQAVENGDRIVVGVNKYCDDAGEEIELETLKLDPEAVKRQKERLNRVRETRAESAVEAALQRIEDAAASDKNLMPVLIEAVKTQATLGEICDAMRQVFGEYQPHEL